MFPLFSRPRERNVTPPEYPNPDIGLAVRRANKSERLFGETVGAGAGDAETEKPTTEDVGSKLGFGEDDEGVVGRKRDAHDFLTGGGGDFTDWETSLSVDDDEGNVVRFAGG
jgi:hypothetical protein